MSSSSSSSDVATASSNEDDKDNDDKDDKDDNDDKEEEWEIVEFEELDESDFINSEWKVGTNWYNKPNEIDTTWVRLIIDPESEKNVAIWGDNSKGFWKIDAAAQFFQISKETFGGWGGKKLWAGPIEDYYYLQGTVRGWNPIRPASVTGQLQMIRLGVDREEAGVAPWFEDEENENENENGESDEKETEALPESKED